MHDGGPQPVGGVFFFAIHQFWLGKHPQFIAFSYRKSNVANPVVENQNIFDSLIFFPGPIGYYREYRISELVSDVSTSVK
jgi:hypothetical protein